MGHVTTQRANARRWTLGLTVAAFALGSFRLGDKGLWLDEIASLNFALGGPEVWFADHNMSLYYALLAGVSRARAGAVRALRLAAPRDEDADPPLFADPRGRVITLQLFTRK